MAIIRGNAKPDTDTDMTAATVPAVMCAGGDGEHQRHHRGSGGEEKRQSVGGHGRDSLRIGGKRTLLARRWPDNTPEYRRPPRAIFVTSGNQTAKGERIAVGTLVMVNRFVPPDSAPTALALERLAGLLRQRLPDGDLVGLGGDAVYGSPSSSAAAMAGPPLEVRRIRSWPQGSGWRRAIATLHDGAALAAAASSYPAVLSLTDPPLLAWWLARRLPPSRVWIEWMMDVYPHALAAASGGRGAKMIGPMMAMMRGAGGRRLPDMRLYLGPGQRDFVATGDQRPVPAAILPVGVCESPGDGVPAPLRMAASDSRIRLVYAGNHGRAHWDEALPLLAEMADPARFQIDVAAFGAGAARLRRRLARFAHVTWHDQPLTAAELAAADVHVASLKPDWTHISLPSKAVTALCLGRPVLFFGDRESDAWRWIDGGGWRVAPDRKHAAVILPEVLTEIAAPPALVAMTRRAVRAGDCLRLAESDGADALAERLSRAVYEPIPRTSRIE